MALHTAFFGGACLLYAQPDWPPRELNMVVHQLPSRTLELSALSAHPLVLGVDDCGRGAIVGPIFAAAVCLPLHWTSPSPIADSKLLSASERRAALSALRAARVPWASAMVSPTQIDAWGHGVSTLYAMRLAASRLSRRLRRANLLAADASPFCIVDGDTLPVGLVGEAIPHADRHETCVAAASLLARSCHESAMSAIGRRHAGFGFETTNGHPSAEHLDRVVELGPCAAHRASCFPFAIQHGRRMAYHPQRGVYEKVQRELRVAAALDRIEGGLSEAWRREGGLSEAWRREGGLSEAWRREREGRGGGEEGRRTSEKNQISRNISRDISHNISHNISREISPNEMDTLSHDDVAEEHLEKGANARALKGVQSGENRRGDRRARRRRRRASAGWGALRLADGAPRTHKQARTGRKNRKGAAVCKSKIRIGVPHSHSFYHILSFPICHAALHFVSSFQAREDRAAEAAAIQVVEGGGERLYRLIRFRALLERRAEAERAPLPPVVV